MNSDNTQVLSFVCKTINFVGTIFPATAEKKNIFPALLKFMSVCNAPESRIWSFKLAKAVA